MSFEIFKDLFHGLNKWLKEKDYDGFIKCITYPFLFIFCVIGQILLFFVALPMFIFGLILLYVLIPLILLIKLIWKGIVWLDKKLRINK